MDEKNEIILKDLSAEVAKTRKAILDLLEMAFGDHPKWPVARSCVLRSLGKSGLEGFLSSFDEKLRASSGNPQLSKTNQKLS